MSREGKRARERWRYRIQHVGRMLAVLYHEVHFQLACASIHQLGPDANFRSGDDPLRFQSVDQRPGRSYETGLSVMGELIMYQLSEVLMVSGVEPC